MSKRILRSLRLFPSDGLRGFLSDLIIPPTPPRPPRRLNPWSIVLAVVVAVSMAPAIFSFQRQRVQPPERRSWRMPDLDGITQSKAEARFGAPLSVRDFELAEGSFAGPRLGLKHYYLFRSADYAAHTKGAQVIWTYSQYSTIREIIWRLPDSYLTLWLDEPRAEVRVDGDTMEMTLPPAAAGEWVALDNYRVGRNLVAHPPSSK